MKSNENSLQERLQYAIEQLKLHNVEFSVKNEQTGHLHCRRQSDDKLVQFWAGTGKIMSYEVRGIHSLVKILTEEPCLTCVNAGWEKMDYVAACNCCENYSYYRPRKSNTQTNQA